MRTCTLAHSYIRRNRNDTKLRKSDIRGYYIDRSEPACIRSVARPRGKRSTSWKVDAIIRAFTRPVSPPRRENCFPYPKGNRIECLENYHRSSVSNFDAGQPPSFLPPKLFHSIGENSFICRLSLSLFSKLSKFEFPRPWKFHVSFEATSNWEVRMNELVLETFSRVAWWSKCYGNFDQNRWGYRSFIIRDGPIVCISEDCINTIIGTMFLEGVSIVFLIRWARDLSTP